MIALVGGHACGVTVSALAMALAAPTPSVLAECDPRFGAVRVGLRQGHPGGEVGLAHLGAALRQGQLREAVGQHLQSLDQDGHRWWLPGLTDPLQAADLETVWEPLAGVLSELEQQGRQVLVDAGLMTFDRGMLSRGHVPVALLHRADLVLVAVRNTPASLARTRPVVRALLEDLEAVGRAGAVRLLVIEQGRMQSRDVAAALGSGLRWAPPVVAALPWDERASAILTGDATGHARLSRQPLLQRARQAARDVQAEAQTVAVRGAAASDERATTMLGHVPPVPEVPPAPPLSGRPTVALRPGAGGGR